jgi:hypothetical protein
MKDLANLDWETILDYLKNEQAALLIGPGIVHIEDAPMNIAWRESIWKNFQNKIAYNYNKDGLFLFANRIAKNNAANHVRKYLNERSPAKDSLEEEVYKKIIQIKFPLVVSINPDTYISDVAYTYGVQHRFSYFRNRSKVLRHSSSASSNIDTYMLSPSWFFPLSYALVILTNTCCSHVDFGNIL